MSDTDPAGRSPPRPAMLRETTDSVVLEELFTHGRVTRAGLAHSTGISRPTISASVRRLEGGGLLRPAGNRTGYRGRVARYYEISPAAGQVLALQLDQTGIRGRLANLDGTPVGQAHHPGVPSGDSDALMKALRTVVRSALESVSNGGPLRAATMSVANPVAPETSTVIELRNSPFPEGWVQPREVLADLVGETLVIDNDVNWATLAERRAGGGAEVSSFAYAYVGGGLGLGLCLGDRLVRGAHGLAGEIGYLNVTGDLAGPLSTVLARQGLVREGTRALDVEVACALLDRAVAGERRATAAVHQLGSAIGQAIAATCTIVDPELVLLGGPIGGHAGLLEPVRAATEERTPTPARIELGTLGESAPLHGALAAALDLGRQRVTPGRSEPQDPRQSSRKV